VLKIVRSGLLPALLALNPRIAPTDRVTLVLPDFLLICPLVHAAQSLKIFILDLFWIYSGFLLDLFLIYS
jgi:hypothetical protein